MDFSNPHPVILVFFMFPDSLKLFSRISQFGDFGILKGSVFSRASD